MKESPGSNEFDVPGFDALAIRRVPCVRLVESLESIQLECFVSTQSLFSP